VPAGQASWREIRCCSEAISTNKGLSTTTHFERSSEIYSHLFVRTVLVPASKSGLIRSPCFLSSSIQQAEARWMAAGVRGQARGSPVVFYLFGGRPGHVARSIQLHTYSGEVSIFNSSLGKLAQRTVTLFPSAKLCRRISSVR
jgi:hypothetical protein